MEKSYLILTILHQSLYIFFYFVLSILFFLVGTRLLFQKGKLANKLLGTQFIILTFLIVVSYFSTEEGLLENPNLFKITSPFVYLIYPIAYLFQEFMFYPNKKFKWYHALHFLPFILNFIEFFPIYISSTELKLDLIKTSISTKSLNLNPSKQFYILSGHTHQIIRLLQFSTYTILLSVRLMKFLKLDRIKQLYKNKVLITWLIGDIVLKYFTVILSSYYFIFPYLNDLQFNWQNILKIIDYVVLVFLLFYYPNLLSGVAFKGFEDPNKKGGTEPLEDPLYRKIDRYFAVERCYLLEDISPTTVSNKLGISSRKISSAIKQQTDLSFPDYVNLWRLQYIEEQLKTNKYWQNYTFEAMASESGFGSRSNFYSAFKKLKDQSPKEYYANLKSFHTEF